MKITSRLDRVLKWLTVLAMTMSCFTELPIRIVAESFDVDSVIRIESNENVADVHLIVNVTVNGQTVSAEKSVAAGMLTVKANDGYEIDSMDLDGTAFQDTVEVQEASQSLNITAHPTTTQVNESEETEKTPEPTMSPEPTTENSSEPSETPEISETPEVTETPAMNPTEIPENTNEILNNEALQASNALSLDIETYSLSDVYINSGQWKSIEGSSGYYHSWSSSNPSIVTVFDNYDRYGSIYAKSVGQAVITHRYYSYGWKEEKFTVYVTAPEQVGYFYIMKPGKENAAYREKWAYAGVGTIVANTPVASKNTVSVSVKSYPQSYPTIYDQDGNAYTYSINGETGTYSIVWDYMIDSSGANDGNEVLTDNPSWHVDGHAILVAKDYKTVDVMVKQPGSVSYSRLSDDYPVLVENGKTLQNIPSVDSEKDYQDKSYLFNGWYTDPECTNKVDIASYKVTSNTTFYGKYDANESTYKIKVNAYAGNRGTGTLIGTKLIENVSWSELSAYYKMEHYELANLTLGTDLSGNGEIITSFWDPIKQDISLTSEEGYHILSLYLKEDSPVFITINYNGNGNTAGSIPSSTTVLKDDSYRIENHGSLEKEGYTFTGWNDKADGSGSAYGEGQTINVNKNMTLYAQWEEIDRGFSAKGFEVTYDGNLHSLEFVGELRENETVQYSVDNGINWNTTNSWMNVCSYSVLVRVMNKHTEVWRSSPVSVKINPREITVTGNHNTIPYDGFAHTVTGVSASNLVKNHSITCDTASVTRTDAGTSNMNLTENTPFKIMSKNVNVTSNYNVVNVEDGYLTITPQTEELKVTITGNNANKVYTGSEQEVTGWSSDAPQGVSVVLTTTARAAGTNAGTYKMNLKAENFKVTSDNYSNIEVVVVDGYLTITPIDNVTIKADNKSKVYGSDDPELTAVVTGLIDKDVLNYKLSREENNNVGTYEIVVTLNNNPNYTVTHIENGEFVIYGEIFYDSNIAAEGEAPSDSNKYKLNDEIKVANRNTLALNEAVFIGWSTEPQSLIQTQEQEDAANIIAEGSTLNQGMTSLTLYAVFAEDKNGTNIPDYREDHYTIIFRAGANGFLNTGNITIEDILIGTHFGDVVKVIPTPVANDGYHFAAWNNPIPANDVEIVGNMEFVANFAINDYTAIVNYIDEDTDEVIATAKEVTAKHGDVVNGEKYKVTIEDYIYTHADSKMITEDKMNVNVYYSADKNHDEIPDKYQIEITYRAVNGTITTNNGPFTLNKVDANGDYAVDGVAHLAEDQIATATANEGYHFESWSPKAPTTEIELSEDTEFVANFAINEYTAIVNYIDEDTDEVIATAKEVTAKHGDVVNGEKYKVTIEDYIYTHAESTTITEDKMNVNVYYSADKNHDEIPDKYQITVTYKAVNGTITANNGPFTLNKVDAKGDYAVDGVAHLTVDQIATATANEGYHFESWSPKVPTTEIELSEDTEFVAKFAINEYTTIVNYIDEDTNEVIATAKPVKVNHGETVNGADHVINIEDYVYTHAESKPITEDNMEVNVYYSADKNHDEIPDKYQIEVTYRAVNGTITANNGPFTLNKVDANGDYAVDGVAHLAEDQIATATANEGYHFESWSPKVPTTEIELSEDTEFVANFAINEYTAIVNYIDEDTDEVIATAKPIKVNHGVVVSGADHVINIEDYVYTHAESKTITEDNMEVNVYYSADKNHDEIPDRYQIEVTYRAVNGTITANNGPFTLNKVDANGDYAVDGVAHLAEDQIATATANEGYHFESWSPKVPTTEIELSEDTEFVANFAINEYTAIVNYIDEDTDEVIGTAKPVKVNHGVVVSGADHVINIEDYVYTHAESKTITEDNMEVNVYYSADKNHDEIPDRYQIEVTYRAVNGTITANNGPFTLNKVDANGDYAVDGVAHLAEEQIATATANEGYHFESWSPKAPTTEIELSEDTEFVANFAINDYTATVNYIDEDTDEVIATVKSLNVKHGEILDGEKYKATIEDYVYTHAESKMIMEDNMNVNVYYSADKNHDEIPDKYQIEVTYRAVNGTVTANNGPFTLNKVDANGDYAVDGVAHLAEDQIATATANEGYHFESWSPKAPTTEIELSEDTEFVANFAINEYTAIVNYIDEDTNKVIGTAKPVKVEHGKTVNGADHVINIEDYIYTHAESKTITEDKMNVNVYYSADKNHDEIPDKYQIEVTYRAVNGTVTANNGPFTLNKVDANGDYAVDGVAHLAEDQIATATANEGYHFESWSPKAPTTEIELSEDTEFVANFAINEYTAIVNYIDEDTNKVIGTAKPVKVEHGKTVNGADHVINIEDYIYTHAESKTITEDKMNVNVYYSADKNHDEIPDKYQIEVTYKAVNGTITANNGPFTLNKVDANGDYAVDGVAHLTDEQIAKASPNNGYQGGTWSPMSPTTALDLTEDTTFTITFTAIPAIPDPEEPEPNPGCPEGTTWDEAAQACLAPFVPGPGPEVPGPGPVNPGPGAEEEVIVEPETPEQGGTVTPTPTPEIEEIEEPEQPEVGHKGSWALINLIASLLGLLAALFLIFAKHQKDDDEEDQNQSAAMNEEDPQQLKRKRIYKWISGLTAVISVIVFVLTENMRLPMILVDKWTLLMVVFFLINAVTLYLGRRWHENEDDEEQTQA
ncbi:InlB B-repeat-containing protein [Holdemania massiliensis]|uniref:InlB B-repeat-containing protein n=1 Tax=Holdemania massiliensis TaxID=1468449 RepID=UPI001F05FA0B|nr:InlB B-repeat-containing protein [Holdemania massiliensis]MCH1939539.1 InlB B-repeat-containing protein [Holdemania massiliensis]